MDHAGIEAEIRSVVISSVVPQVVFNLRVLSDRYFGTRPLVVGKPEVKLGVPVRVDPTTTVGADRLVNTVGAWDRYGGDLIVVDFGTATTFDVVDFNGAYKGGIIAPGINLSLDALVNNTAKLPRIAIEAPRGNLSVIGRNTEDQMHIGVFWGYVAMMEGLVARLRAEIGRPAKVIATGGLALLFDEHTEIFDAVETDLTLTGLAILAERAAAR
jgi:type III pantothenate kinase